MADNNVSDIWRMIFPSITDFSWFRPNGSCKSRIDYWLGSDCIRSLVSKITMSNAPLSDHRFIELILEPTNKLTHRKGFWKFNAKLLQNEDYCSKIRETISEIQNYDAVIGHSNKWEFIKFRISDVNIHFSKVLAKKNKEMESKLLQ